MAREKKAGNICAYIQHHAHKSFSSCSQYTTHFSWMQNEAHTKRERKEKSKMMMKDENRVQSDGKALNIKTPDVVSGQRQEKREKKNNY